jgi:hypothetical protein
MVVCESRDPTFVAKDDRVAREAKGTWCVVLCGTKFHVATETAHHSKLDIAHLEQFTFNE